MLSKWIFLALLISVGLANAQYARGTFYFQSGATVIAIGAIMWIPPTNATGDIIAERWIFGNVSYTGTNPEYQAFVFDLENKTITCELNTGNCFTNQTGVKRGWHSIRVYLRNIAGQNWSEQRYIYMNVSADGTTPQQININIDKKADLNPFIIAALGFLFALIIFAINKKNQIDYEKEQEDNEDIAKVFDQVQD